MDKINTKLLTGPTLIEGSRFVDDRGSLLFMNSLTLSDVKRFYLVENHRQGFVRAWHGHLKESKLFFPIEGAFQVGVARIDDKGNPLKESAAQKFILDSAKPVGLFIPAGFANGSKSLTENAKLLIFSSTSLDESKGDDYRIQYDYWNIWNEDFR